MRVFITGGTGYLGSAVAAELKRQGHIVVALARSAAAERALEREGYEVVRGDLRDSIGLAKQVTLADGVIHAAFAGHEEGPALDEEAVGTMLGALEGSMAPFLYTSGVWIYGSTGDTRIHEDDMLTPPAVVAWRPGVEELVKEAADRNVRSVVIRPGVVYGGEGGLLQDMALEALEDDVVRVVGQGTQRWSYVHRRDLARLYVMALEEAGAGTVFNATAPPSPTLGEVARALSLAVGGSGRIEPWPLEEARRDLGPVADALALDQANISNEWAEESLGWIPRQPPVLAHIMAESNRNKSP